MITDLEKIAPKTKARVYDLVQSAGLDVSDWANYKRPAYPAANPKYCYDWSFVDDEKVVLNLWYAGMKEAGGVITYKTNLREFAHRIARMKDDPLRKKDAKANWETRALKLDRALQHVARRGLPVRVIVCEGEMRAIEDDKSSEVDYRLLDAEPWGLSKYDWDTGDAVLTRGAAGLEFVDQFSADGSDIRPPVRRLVETTVVVRSADVRRQVLLRARGFCELCGTRGFETASGKVYLETHHVIPLSEDGDDLPTNVVAICATDHRRAHHSAERDDIRRKLLTVAAGGGRVPPSV